jgi:hypothetical protein
MATAGINSNPGTCGKHRRAGEFAKNMYSLKFLFGPKILSELNSNFVYNQPSIPLMLHQILQRSVYFRAATRDSRTYNPVSQKALFAPAVRIPYLDLDLGLGNVLLASLAGRDLLGLGQLGTGSLNAELVEGVGLNGVDAQLGVGLDDSETSGDYNGCKFMSRACPVQFDISSRAHIPKYCLVVPASSMISTRPGRSCSTEGTWFARTPMSPLSAGMLTWRLHRPRFCQHPSNYSNPDFATWEAYTSLPLKTA